MTTKPKTVDKDGLDFRWDTAKTKYTGGEVLLMHLPGDKQKYAKLPAKVSSFCIITRYSFLTTSFSL